MENRIRPLWVVIILLSGILIGLYINKGVAKKIQVEGGSKFDEVMWYVGNDYVEKPDAQKLQDGVFSCVGFLLAMCNSLVLTFNIVYSVYLGKIFF